MPRRAPNRWPEERERALIAMIGDGRPLQEMAVLFGVSVNAITTKRYHLRLMGMLPSRAAPLCDEPWKLAAQRICEAHGVTLEDILVLDRTHKIHQARIAIAAMLRHERKLSYPQIARLMRRRHHTSIMALLQPRARTRLAAQNQQRQKDKSKPRQPDLPQESMLRPIVSA